MKTWVKEILFVIAALTATWAFSGTKPVEVLGTIAVILTFCYVQVATRLDEQMARCESDENKSHEIHCRVWLNRYLVMKEAMWCIYFVYLGGWSALVGVVIFLLYPLWRNFHNGRKVSK